MGTLVAPSWEQVLRLDCLYGLAYRCVGKEYEHVEQHVTCGRPGHAAAAAGATAGSVLRAPARAAASCPQGSTNMAHWAAMLVPCTPRHAPPWVTIPVYMKPGGAAGGSGINGRAASNWRRAYAAVQRSRREAENGGHGRDRPAVMSARLSPEARSPEDSVSHHQFGVNSSPSIIDGWVRRCQPPAGCVPGLLGCHQRLRRAWPQVYAASIHQSSKPTPPSPCAARGPAACAAARTCRLRCSRVCVSVCSCGEPTMCQPRRMPMSR